MLQTNLIYLYFYLYSNGSLKCVILSAELVLLRTFDIQLHSFFVKKFWSLLFLARLNMVDVMPFHPHLNSFVSFSHFLCTWMFSHI